MALISLLSKPTLTFTYSMKYFHERASFNKFRVRSIRTIDASPNVDLRIKRSEPEFILPAQPAPIEMKPLSDLDSWDQIRVRAPFLIFYKRNPEMKERRDHGEVIKRALAEALVYYYPLAGRLVPTIDTSTGKTKLWVDCGRGASDAGVLFVKAEADIELTEVGDNVLAPNPCCTKQLLWTWEENFDKEFESFTICGPLLSIQVTKFKCGGIALGVVAHHCVTDGYGISLFLAAMCEIARGQNVPSIPPIWLRDQFLCARTHPQVTCAESEFRNKKDVLKIAIREMRETSPISIVFDSKDVQTLRDRHNLQSCTKYELITACLWKCSTILRRPDPEEVTRLTSATSVRGTRAMIELPKGYYGNSILMPMSMCSVGHLVNKPLVHAVKLVKQTKLRIRDPEYVRSFVDHIATRPSIPDHRLRFFISDISQLGHERFDFGWGQPVNVVSAIVISMMRVAPVWLLNLSRQT
ncbi:hypothetical protein M569_03064 [Genlisea aurea]|uniref:Uncharacterized protein n=1 Tax=Genlisea aurea TaxID=192259 RepID=S8CWB1_9LAMI|nr:hypothetical protein M569_03064 [Genlisea aurea]